ncbi:MAG: Pur ac phosph protein [Patescibacteria group bacterium]|nr:Pur ac phosph protein [Patescibacteria group bacterium]
MRIALYECAHPNIIMAENKDKKKGENDGELIPLSGAAKLSGYTPEYLNSLSRKGVLQAKKIGRNWHTTREWLDALLESHGKKNGIAKAATDPDQPEGRADENGKAEKDFFVLAGASKTEKEKKTFYEISPSETDAPKKVSNRPEWFQLFSALASMAIALPLIFAGASFVKTNFKNINGEENFIRLAEAPELEGASVILNEASVLGEVRGEEDVNEAAEKKSESFLSSENFKISEISFGGIALAMNVDQELPLEIFEVRSESFISNKKDEVKLVVSWKTNKLAMSELAYAKNNGQNSKAVKEQSYGFNHSAVLSDLDPRTSYVYSIKCKDHWGNEMLSNYFGIYTASKPVSVFDLISKAMNDVFGWALN